MVAMLYWLPSKRAPHHLILYPTQVSGFSSSLVIVLVFTA